MEVGIWAGDPSGLEVCWVRHALRGRWRAQNLTAQRTAALRMELAGRSDVALTAVVHALALPLFFQFDGESCLALRLDSASLHGSAEDIEDSAAGRALAEWHASWLRRLPKTPETLWDWLLAQDQATRLDLLAYCAGRSINAVRKRHEADDDRLHHADQLREISARFGRSPHTVRQRLKLASVAPSLIEAYRDGQMTLDHLMAFTVSDDVVRRGR